MTRTAAALCALLATPLAAQSNPPDSPDWPLVWLDGAEPGFAATLNREQDGLLRGRGPCNSYSAAVTGEPPAFKIEAVQSTKMACPDLAAEQRFFDLLPQMTHAGQLDGNLTLTGNGHVMVFSPAQ